MELTFIGMKIKHAGSFCKRNNIEYRINSKDGIDAAITQDYKPARYNFDIKGKKEIIVRQSLG